MGWLPNIFKKSDRLVPHPHLPETLPPILGQSGSANKSIIGKQLRAALGGAFSGSQVTNHREEALHFENFSYVAIHAIGMHVASASVSAYVDGDQQQQNQSRRKSLQSMYGSRWKAIYGNQELESLHLERDHELMKLLQRPNPHEPGSSFRYRQAIQIRLCGGAYIWNVPNAFGRTCQRYVIPVVSMTPVFPSADLPYGGYRVQPNCMRWVPLDDDGYVSGIPALARVLGMVIDAREIQKCGYPHPIYLDDFQSPMSAGSQWVDGERAINQARTSGISRGLDPSILVTLPDRNQDVDQDELDRATKAYEQKYGGPQQVGKPMVAAPGTEVQVLGQSPKDMGYHEGYEDHKAAVLALHNTPPVAVGLQEPGAYAAYYASMKAWKDTAINPLCDMIAESDTFHLAPQFGEGITVEMEAQGVNDTSETRANVQVAIQAKSITKNTVNTALGFDPLEGEEGDKLAGPDEPDKAAAENPGKTPPSAKPDDDTQTEDEPAETPEDPTVEKPEFPEAQDSPFKRDDTGKKPESQSKALRAAIKAAHEGDEEYLTSKLGGTIDRIVEARLKSMTADEIHRAVQEAEEPTNGQREAGNYRKGHITLHGMRISIENPKGSIRSGKDSNGRKWSVEMAAHYGYIKGTQSGADGDHIDVFVGPNPDSELVFVVDQVKPDGKFDEHKAMLGYNSKSEAKQGYLDNYSSGWKGLGDITPMHIDQFKEWLNDGDSSEPIAEPCKAFPASNPRYITREELMNYKSLKSHDVSGEARDEGGKWTSGGSVVPKKLYRAADDDDIRIGHSFAEEREAAEAYLDNPGFGGEKLHRTDVNLHHVLDITDAEDPWQALSEAAGVDIDPGQFQHHLPRVLPTSDEICEALASNGIHWVRFHDDFPEGAVTIIPVSQDAVDEAEDNIREIKKRPSTKSLGMSTSIGSDGGFAVPNDQPSDTVHCPKCGSDEVGYPRGDTGNKTCLECKYNWRIEPNARELYDPVMKRWVTFKPHGKEEDSYLHVFINDESGTIEAGPQSMVGKKPNELGKRPSEPKKEEHVETEQQKHEPAETNDVPAGSDQVTPEHGTESGGHREPIEQPAGHAGTNDSGTVSRADTALPNGPGIITARDEHTRKPSASRLAESIARHLSPEQRHGAELAIESMDARGGFLNADGTGIGKTRQVLATAKHYADSGHKVLIVAPSEVIKPDWKKKTLAGSYADDGEAMGINPQLVKGDEGLAPGQVRMTTYGELGDMQSHVDKNTVVLFDEAHGLKNHTSKQGKAGMDIANAAKSTMFATATPADKPDHLNYLMRAGVFHGMKKDVLFPQLGLKDNKFFNPHTGREQSKWEVDPKVGKAGFQKRLGVLFDSLTSKGAMIKRELSLEGVGIHSKELNLPAQCHDQMKEAAEHISRHSNANAGLTKAAILGAQRRIQEPYKIPAAVDAAKEALSQGRQVVIFVQRVNDTTVGKEPDAEDNLHSGGTAGLLKKALEEHGITDIAELHGGNKGKGKAAGAMNDFQSGKHRVIIATVESGGTGVNLDDRKGDAPRTTIMMTPPLGATPYMQALGRTHRKTTRSKSDVVNLYGDTDVEKWNRAIIDSKLSSLHAITGSKQHDDGIEHLANLSGEAIEEMAAHRDLEKPDKDAEREARDLDRLRVNLGMKKPETPSQAASAPSQHTVPVTGVPAATHTNSDHEHLIKNGVNPEHVGRFKKYIRVSGNTYANKDEIRSIGGEYDGGDKVWHVPLKADEESEGSTHRYLSKLPGLQLRHVWHDRSTKRNVPRNA